MFSLHKSRWLSLVALRRDRRAATSLEYGLIAFMIAGAIATAVPTVGSTISAKFDAILLAGSVEVSKL